MKQILRLLATRHLTEQQVLTAGRFRRDPNRFKLAPTGFRLLHDVILKECPLEQIERTRGWSARSAKVVLSVLLHMIEETEGVFWSTEEDGSARDMLAYLTGEDDHERLDLQRRFQLSPIRAHILQVLLHARGPLSRDTLLRRLEARGPDTHSADALTVHISHIRKALPADLTIRTHRGFGYELVQSSTPHPPQQD